MSARFVGPATIGIAVDSRGQLKTAPAGAVNANSEPDRTSLALPKEMG